MFVRTATAIVSGLLIAGGAAAAPAQAATVAPVQHTVVAHGYKASTPQPISLGSRGPAVKALQEVLANFADSPAYVGEVGTVDGYFGAYTERAVKGVQLRNGLPVTGVVDARTWKALGFITRHLQSAGPVLHQDDRGVYVTDLQNLLNKAGQNVTVDGYYGAEGVAAVKAVQKANHLSETGVVDIATWTVLRSYAG